MSNIISRLRLIVSILLLAPLVTGCFFSMGYQRQYEGELRPLSDVAIIVQLSTSTESWIDYIDGKDLHTPSNVAWGRLAVTDIQELTPGKHTICSGYTRSKGSSIDGSTGCIDIELDAKPGHVYFFYPRINTHKSAWQPDYWDITDDLHIPELKKVTDEVDKSLAKNRGGNTISILSLGTKRSNSPLIGFGEEHKSNLKRWLNKNVTVFYKFDRYVPYIVVEADDGIKYHLEIDQQTGDVSNVFGKDIVVYSSFAEEIKAFQPLNSKIAYQEGRWNAGNKYSPNWVDYVVKWEEQKDGSFIKIK